MRDRPKQLVVAYAVLAALLYLVLLIPGPLGMSPWGAVGSVTIEGLVVWGLWRGSVLSWSLALFFALGGAASTVLAGASRGAQVVFFLLICVGQAVVLLLPSPPRPGRFQRERRTPAL